MSNLESGRTKAGTYYTELPVSSLKHPEKYDGKRKILELRSSWEMAMVHYLDNNPSILGWSSEEVIVKYFNPLKQRPARYFPDFRLKYQTPKGIKEALVEVKPFHETQKPKITEGMSEKSKAWAMSTYYINQAK